MADVTFAHYFQSELAYYRELAREYVAKYPEISHMIGERGSDPSVERLLQGAALITARLRQGVEDDFKEIIHPIFLGLWPQYLNPMQAVTFLQAIPTLGALRHSQTIKAGVQVKSNPVASTKGSGSTVECLFQTSHAVQVHPLEIVQATSIRAHPTDLQFKVRFEMMSGTTFDTSHLSSLRLHFIGANQLRYTLFYWLSHLTKRIAVCDEKGKVQYVLPRSAVRPLGLTADEGLFSNGLAPMQGLQFLHEYFILPEKFLGVEVKGLDRVPPNALHEAFELVFHLGTTPPLGMPVGAENLALSCVPATNRSESELITIQTQTEAFQYCLEAPHGGQVLSVDRVGGHLRATGQWIDFIPLGASRAVEHDETKPRFSLTYRSDGVEGPQSYLVLTDANAAPISPGTDQLNVWMTYTNGTLPLNLDRKTINQSTSTTPEFVTFDNITPVVAGEPLRLDLERHWHLLSIFKQSPESMISQRGITQLLDEATQGKTGVNSPEIVSASYRHTGNLVQQTIVPKRQINIELLESDFQGVGQLFLFANLLSHLFIRPAGSLVFNQLTVKALPGGQAFCFPMR